MPYAVSINVLKAPDSQLIIRVEIRNSGNNTIASRVELLPEIGLLLPE
jgi:hypothetical protein